MLGAPIGFEVTATNEATASNAGKTGGYVKHYIYLPEGVAAGMVGTAVVVGEDGEIRHLPTKIERIGVRYAAVVSSLTDGTFVLIDREASFKDTANHWANDIIADLERRGVIMGYTADNFAPERTVTRAEFAAMLVRALGLQQEASAVAFTDVQGNDWFNQVVSTASRYGLIQGYEDGTFRPNDNITREQAMTMIARAIDITELDAGTSGNALAAFADGANVSDWAVSGMEESLNAGLVTGAPRRSLLRRS